MGQGNNFWSKSSIDPKRSFRWILHLSHIPSFVVKSTAKPQIQVSNVPHQYIAHTFNYPGRVTWQPLEVTIVDPVYPDASARLVKILQASGYALPVTPQDGTISLSKAEAVKALGQPVIEQLDATGNPIDRWKLWNAWIEKVTFGSLDYKTEDMVNVGITFRFDYAEYSGAPTEGAKVAEPNPVMDPGKDQHNALEDIRAELG
jgi:hypothetical protein